VNWKLRCIIREAGKGFRDDGCYLNEQFAEEKGLACGNGTVNGRCYFSKRLFLLGRLQGWNIGEVTMCIYRAIYFIFHVWPSRVYNTFSKLSLIRYILCLNNRTVVKVLVISSLVNQQNGCVWVKYSNVASELSVHTWPMSVRQSISWLARMSDYCGSGLSWYPAVTCYEHSFRSMY